MATPILTSTQGSITIPQASANKVSFPAVLDEDGAPLDVSAGFTAVLKYLNPTLDTNNEVPSFTGTFAYGADGVITLTQTIAQAALIPAGFFQAQLWISDDAMVTRSKACDVSVNCVKALL